MNFELVTLALPILALTARSPPTPREACLRQANYKLDDLNIARSYSDFILFNQQGYGYEIESQFYDEERFARIKNDINFRNRCAKPRPDGTIRRYECSFMAASSIGNAHIPVNIDEERQVNSNILRAIATEKPIAAQAEAQCRATHPG